MVGFNDKIAVVTGGGSGIGRTICVYLAERGARVVVADRNVEGFEETVSLVSAAGGAAEGRRVDVADPGEVNSLICGVATSCGRIGPVQQRRDQHQRGVPGPHPGSSGVRHEETGDPVGVVIEAPRFCVTSRRMRKDGWRRNAIRAHRRRFCRQTTCATH